MRHLRRSVMTTAAAALLMLSCSEPVAEAPSQPAPPPPPLRGTLIDSNAVAKLVAHHFPRRTCVDLAKEAVRLTAPAAVECDEKDAGECARIALLRKTLFTIFHSGFGMDSFISSAVIGSANGDVTYFYDDSMGPAFRATCRAQWVVASDEGWPACRRELVDRVDLRTCGPVAERFIGRYEERFPAGCTDRVVAENVPVRIAVLHRTPLLADYAKWKIPCHRFHPTFEVVIDEHGNIRCARVVSVNGDRPQPQGLYDEIRANAMRWRFAPPRLYGEPVEVRWTLQQDPDCTNAPPR